MLLTQLMIRPSVTTADRRHPEPPPSDTPVSNVLVLVGTRPEAIKMFPVVHALRRSPWF